MRKIVLSLHTTLDGFVGGPKGEMDWIKLDDGIFDLVATFTQKADTVLYGRVTYQMMNSYWPTAAEKSNASKHDIEHSTWYNMVDKVVLSRTIKGNDDMKTRFISRNIFNEINDFRNQPGKDILMFGSPTAAHSLMEYNLIDEYWLFVNPIILGQGIPLFAHIKERINLERLTTKLFSCGVTALNYSVVR